MDRVGKIVKILFARVAKFESMRLYWGVYAGKMNETTDVEKSYKKILLSALPILS